MDQRDKEAARERHERFLRKHYRTREEQKTIEGAAKARRAARRERRPRRRDWRDGDEAATFERMETRPRDRAAAEPAAAGPRRDDVRPGGAVDAEVVAVHRDRVRVRAVDRDREEDVRPPREPTGGDAASRPVVGDEVYLVRDADGAPRLAGVAPRRTYLARPDPADPRRERVLAANVDRVVVVSSAGRPAFRPGLVDRMLLAAGRGGALPLVCVNKADLLDGEAARTELVEQTGPWRALAVPCLLVSAESGAGLDELADALRGSTCVFVGHSGVGKSTLLNALAPGAARDTGAGRAFDGKGRHTTTASQLVALADGTRVIDTPGVRQFGLWDVGPAELAAAFPEVAAAAAECRFRDCRHDREPDCGVRAAVARGAVAAARFRVWARLRDEVES